MSLNFIETKRSIKEVVNERLSNFAEISVVPDGVGCVCIVVGASWEKSGACCFASESLTELINHLTQIRDVLTESYVE